MEFGLFTCVTLISSLYQVSALASKKEVCLLQVDEGPCRGDITRFYYNTISQKCEEFSYGGCQGNGNNFMSFEHCQKTCWRIPKIPQICRFRGDGGPCRALLPRYFFNMTTMQCEMFYYGGCQGNDNRFQNQVSCMEYCRPHRATPVICHDPLDKGKCTASIPRYYYNSASKMCEEFMYTGCGGSSNNFVSRQSCRNVCTKGGRSRKKPKSYKVTEKARNHIRRKTNIIMY